MSRLIREDFAEFIAFLNVFDFSALIKNDDYIALMRASHAKLLGLLAMVSELRHEDGSAAPTFLDDYLPDGSLYLGEVLSDCSEALMCIALGCNRAAAGALRSAIESFAKAFALGESPEILHCTSVPEVFGFASGSSFFSHEVAARAFSDLRSIYSELNLFVHTVAPGNMFSVPAVGHFPRYQASSTELVGLFVRTVRLFLLCGVSARRDLFDAFDHRNRDVIVAALTKDQRRLAFGT